MPTTKTPHLRRPPQNLTPSFRDNVVDKLIALFGTWKVFLLHIVGFSIWIYYGWEINSLTFWVSLEAILLSLLILMSQNRQTKFDRRQALADFEIDRHSEKQTRILIGMIREIGEKIGIKNFEVDTKNIEVKEIIEIEKKD